ncbi:MAG: FtsX-like permease family protein, partial [bacterium]|nr:FtsX-like permease family protein [bacterium]
MNPKEKYFDLSPFSSLIIRFLFGDEGGMKLGDFNEVYNDLIERKGSLRARFSFWNYVLLSILQNTKSSIFRSYDMFKNYMKIIFRNFKRQKGYTFINVFGLSVGITCFIFIMMYVKYELSYDTFNENSDRIHRIIQHYEAWNFRGSSEFASTNGAMANVLPDEFSEIEYAIRVRTTQSALKYGQNSIVEIGIFADKDFLNTFTYPLIAGDPNNALKDPNSIVLTEELANKLFKDEDPIGKVLQGSNGLTFKVTGICENVPDNSHLQFDFIISFRTMYSLRNDIDTSWGILNYANYVLLKENIDYREFEKKLDLLIEKYHAPSDIVRHYYLQPVTDIHLDSHINTFMDTPGDRKYIYLFSTVAFLILIIASVNYVNLATSRASLRGKEVGIRKTVGALRTELMKQFLGESIMLTLIALSVSLILVYMIHPFFQIFIGQNIPLDLLLNPVSLTGLFLLIFTVGFISGCYPSFLLSSFRPMNVLKPGAKTINVNNHFKLRNILVVFQFFVSVVLIVATLVINKQLSFIINKDIGYQRENIITVRLWDSQNAEKFETIKEDLVRNSNIINVTVSDRAPLRASENNTVRVEDE